MPGRFNIRVYGIWLHEGMLLVNEEQIRGRSIIKLPGGGLEWGEGLHDCLIREWKEELGMNITVLNHFYTTHFFQPSAFDDSQVISIYYTVAADPNEKIMNHVANERTYWLPISSVSAETFTLPIDKIVGDMLKQQYIHQYS